MAPKHNAITKHGKKILSFDGSDSALELLTVEQLAERLNCSTSFLNKARLTGDGPPFVRMGGCIRYRPIDVADWIKSSIRTSTSAA